MIGGVEDVGVVIDAQLLQRREQPVHGLVDQLVLHVDDGVHLAHLILRELARVECNRAALGVAKASFVPVEPVPRTRREALGDGLRRARVPGRQVQLTPGYASEFARRRIEGVMWIGRLTHKKNGRPPRTQRSHASARAAIQSVW